MHTARFGRAERGLARLLCLLFFSLAWSTAGHAQLNAGDIYITDRDALFKVDPATGQRTLISDFDDPAKGPLGATPEDLAIRDSSILVIDPGARRLPEGDGGALFGVDAATGQRTLISDFSDPNQGPLGLLLRGVAIASSGKVLVTNGGGAESAGRLFSIDPTTGQRTVLSEFGNPSQGPLGVNPIGVAVATSGNILVVASLAGAGPVKGALFSVDPATGHRTVLSDFSDPTQGPLGAQDPRAIDVDDSGDIFVIDSLVSEALLSVDPTTGQRTVLSDLDDPNQGEPVDSATDLAVANSGRVLVVDNVSSSETAKLLNIDPVTGQRTVISDFGNPAQGPLGFDPAGVAVVPQALTCNGLPVTILGTANNDTLPGTNGDDVIHGLGGNDAISAGNGKDIVCGGEGNDVINGGNGADQLFGEAGNDALKGNNGRDELFGGEGGDDLDGGNGKDVLAGEEGDDLLSGGRGKDSLDGGPDNDECDGDRGKDTAQNCETMTSVP